jgi:hypothetical protein
MKIPEMWAHNHKKKFFEEGDETYSAVHPVGSRTSNKHGGGISPVVVTHVHTHQTVPVGNQYTQAVRTKFIDRDFKLGEVVKLRPMGLDQNHKYGFIIVCRRVIESDK